MSDKYLLNFEYKDRNPLYNATLKPREDIKKILQNNNYKIIEIPYFYNSGKINKIYNFFIAIIKIIPTLIKINKIGNKVVIQYPLRTPKRNLFNNILFKILNKSTKIILIHDIHSLRYEKEISPKEVEILNLSDKIICHTENMKKHLQSHGVKSDIEVLWLFDYLAKDSCPEIKIKDESIVFAGNLKKSIFLRKLSLLQNSYRIHLYGASYDYNWGKNITYEGKFNPDEIGSIKGTWGLVWDGDSIETCIGDLGHYLQYNSSHKASLYLSAGKPLIVWKNSGIAEYVEKNNLGITIDSLNDIYDKIRKLTTEELVLIQNGVYQYQKLLREGNMIKSSV